MRLFRPPFRMYLFLSLLLLNAVLWAGALLEKRNGLLKLSFLDIGQGDAIYIEAPNGAQMIIDGGPGDSLVEKLGREIPFFDRSIDALAVTNPDNDHFAGFLSLPPRFKVGVMIEPGTKGASSAYLALEDALAGKGSAGRNGPVRKVIARQGMRLFLDKQAGVFLDFLFPDRDVSHWATNDGSLVAILHYGKTLAYLGGDSPQHIEKYLTGISGGKNILGPELRLAQGGTRNVILKAGHHGSRTGTSPALVAALHPDWAVISAGKQNSYAFPHPETLATLRAAGVPWAGTYGLGNLTFLSDGISFREMSR